MNYNEYLTGTLFVLPSSYFLSFLFCFMEFYIKSASLYLVKRCWAIVRLAARSKVAGAYKKTWATSFYILSSSFPRVIILSLSRFIHLYIRALRRWLLLTFYDRLKAYVYKRAFPSRYRLLQREGFAPLRPASPRLMHSPTNKQLTESTVTTVFFSLSLPLKLDVSIYTLDDGSRGGPQVLIQSSFGQQ